MQHTAVFFLSATGVHRVELPEHEAIQAVSRFPHEWSFSRVFAEAPEGWVPSQGDGGGRVRAD